MGTNYYWRHNICACCNRYDEWHICKSLVSFQGHFDIDEWDEQTISYRPTKVLVASWEQWKTLLRTGGEVWSESGYSIPTDEFINDVESTDPANRRRQYDWCVSHPNYVDRAHIDRVDRSGNWLDADGFSFYGGEFS